MALLNCIVQFNSAKRLELSSGVEDNALIQNLPLDYS